MPKRNQLRETACLWKCTNDDIAVKSVRVVSRFNNFVIGGFLKRGVPMSYDRQVRGVPLLPGHNPSESRLKRDDQEPCGESAIGNLQFTPANGTAVVITNGLPGRPLS